MKVTLNENSTIEEIENAKKFIGEKVMACGQEWDECNGKRQNDFVYIVTEIDAKARTIDGDIIDANSGKLICKDQRIGNFCIDWEVTIETLDEVNPKRLPEYTAIVYDCNGDISRFEGKNKKHLLREIGEFVTSQTEYMGTCSIELTKKGAKEIECYKLPAGKVTAIYMDNEVINEY